jgi:hypothetical protein
MVMARIESLGTPILLPGGHPHIAARSSHHTTSTGGLEANRRRGYDTLATRSASSMAGSRWPRRYVRCSTMARSAASGFLVAIAFKIF